MEEEKWGSSRAYGNDRPTGSCDQFFSSVAVSSLSDVTYSDMVLSSSWQASESMVVKPKLNTWRVDMCGRSRELSRLLGSYGRVRKGGRFEVVLVHGRSGSGKSTLVESLRQAVSFSDGYFVAGKYQDQQRFAVPFAAIVEALSDMCDLILQDPDRERLCEALESALEFGEASMLCRLVSNLNRCVNINSSIGSNDGSVKGADADFARVKRATQKLLNALGKPLLFFLDDIQWADESSLELLTSLANSRECNQVLFVCAYGGGSTTDCARIKELFVDKLAAPSSGSSVVDIPIRNFDLPSTNLLVSGVVGLPQSRSLELSRVVHDKTSGSPLYILQFLRALEADKFLSWNGNQWTWDEEAIRTETNVSPNVVDLLTSTVSMTAPLTFGLLQLAALIGCRFEVDLLCSIVFYEFAKRGPDPILTDIRVDLDCAGLNLQQVWAKVQEGLRTAEEEGFVEKVDANRFKFSHDKVQEAFIGTLSKVSSRVERLHLMVGRTMQGHLKARTEPTQSDEVLIFAVADHLNQGSDFLCTEQEKLNCALANQSAAKLAISKFSVKVARMYLEDGLKHLDPKIRWERYYDLTVDLTTNLAFMAYYSSDFENCRRLAKEVLRRSDDEQRRNNLRELLVDSLAMEFRMQEALDLSVKFLRDTNVRLLPSEVSQQDSLFLMKKLRNRLRKLNDDDIVSMPTLKDEDAIYESKLLCGVGRFAGHIGDDSLAAYAFLQLLKHTLDNGMSENVPYIFTRYGMICQSFSLGHGLRFHQDASRAAQLALKLLNRVTKMPSRVKAMRMLYAFLLHWKEPLGSCIGPLKETVKLGLAVGEVWTATSAAALQMNVSCLVGTQTLSSIQEYCQSVVQRVKTEYGSHDKWVDLTRPSWQTAENLLGKNEINPPSCMTGERMNEETLENAASVHRQIYLVQKLQLCCLFGDWGSAERVLSVIEHQGLVVGMKVICLNYAYKFLAGVTYLSLYGQTRRRTFLQRGRGCLTWLAKLEKSGCPNVKPMCAYLRAKTASLSSIASKSEVVRLYKVAASAARELGFLSHEAFAHESAGLFLAKVSSSRQGEPSSSCVPLLQAALECYERWGAQAKTDRLYRVVNHLQSERLASNDTFPVEEFDISQGRAASICRAVPS